VDHTLPRRAATAVAAVIVLLILLGVCAPWPGGAGPAGLSAAVSATTARERVRLEVVARKPPGSADDSGDVTRVFTMDCSVVINNPRWDELYFCDTHYSSYAGSAESTPEAEQHA
jgi:hypothetical protein